MTQRRQWGGDLLKAFLDANGVTLKRAAEELRVPASSLHYWIAGDQTPNADSAARIARWTRGAVPADSWVHPDALEEFRKVKPFKQTGSDG